MFSGLPEDEAADIDQHFHFKVAANAPRTVLCIFSDVLRAVISIIIIIKMAIHLFCSLRRLMNKCVISMQYSN